MSTQLESAAPVQATASKYLTVELDGESYGIEVLKVREIVRLQPITPVPQLPAFCRGVINLRGRVVPVTDLRRRFGLKDSTTERTCIVVVRLQLEGRPSVAMGLVVDAVEEVVNVTAEDTEPTPDFGVAIESTYIRAMAKIKGKVKALLDIDRVFEAAREVSVTS